MLTPETDLGTALARRGISRRQLVKFCSAMLATLAHAGTISGPDRRGRQQGEEAGAGLAAISGLHRMLGIDAAIEPSGCRRRRARPAFVGVPRSHHGGRGRLRESNVLDRVVKEDKGKYLVVVEGAIPTADGGVYCTIGGHTRYGDRRDRSAATPRPPSPWAPARSTAGWSAPSPIRPARWAFRRPCPGSR